MKRFEFLINLSSEQYLNYYRGTVNQVVVQCTTGATVQFPAALLTRFVTATGVQGRFVLTCDDQHRGSEMRRLPLN